VAEILVGDTVGIVVHLERGQLGDQVDKTRDLRLAHGSDKAVNGEVDGEVHPVTQLNLDCAISSGIESQSIVKHSTYSPLGYVLGRIRTALSLDLPQIDYMIYQISSTLFTDRRKLRYQPGKRSTRSEGHSSEED